MFKKLISHDKSKLKNNSTDNNSSSINNHINNSNNNNTKITAKDQLRKPEKETPQHIENALDTTDDEAFQQVPTIEEDPKDFDPLTDDPNLPFGDGSNKIFGMENFGNTCYCNSILQVLYYTTSFRKAILTFPERDPDHFRKRRLNVPGDKTHAFVQLQYNNNSGSQQQGTSDPLQEEETKVERKKTGIFGKNKSGKNGGSSSTSTSNLNPPVTNGNTVINSSNGHSTIGGNSDSGNNGNAAINNPHLIDKNIANKYPALKSIKPMYQLNQQRTLSILGDTEDPTANSEKRKRHALLQGPIINLDHLYNNTYGMEKNLFTTLKDIFECMVENKSQTGVVSPQKLIEVLKEENELFRSSMHQDAHEFLNFLINSVLEVVDTYDINNQTSLNDSTTRNPSTSSSLDLEKKSIHEIFEGLLTSETKCLCCERTSARDEKFLDLSIDLTGSSSITNCLKQFSQSEMLQEQNKFYCDSCHSLQEAAKTIKLKKSPKILALHLKRFKYSEELNRNTKLFHRVTYPKTLRLFNTITDTPTPDKLYQLYAVVVHIGGGPHHGHYVSLIKTENFGWLLFDDEAVESIDENYVFKFFGDGPGLATAYVLFYKEIDEITNMKNNLFDAFEQDRVGTTLDMNFNHVTGNLNERLDGLQLNTPNDSLSDSKKSDENNNNNINDSNGKIKNHDSSIENNINGDVSSSSSSPQVLQQPPPVAPQQQLRNPSSGSNENRKSKIFGWKK